MYQGMLEHKGLMHISSRMFAGLLHKIIEEGSVQEELKDLAYTGVFEDLAERGKELLAESDEPLMKIRWLRLTIHKEIDVVKATLEAKGELVPLMLDVDGTVAEPEQGSLLEEVEQKASSHIHALEEARRTELNELLAAAVAAEDYSRAAELQAELQGTLPAPLALGSGASEPTASHVPNPAAAGVPAAAGSSAGNADFQPDCHVPFSPDEFHDNVHDSAAASEQKDLQCQREQVVVLFVYHFRLLICPPLRSISDRHQIDSRPTPNRPLIIPRSIPIRAQIDLPSWFSMMHHHAS
jgi:hypothetical protein